MDVIRPRYDTVTVEGELNFLSGQAHNDVQLALSDYPQLQSQYIKGVRLQCVMDTIEINTPFALQIFMELNGKAIPLGGDFVRAPFSWLNTGVLIEENDEVDVRAYLGENVNPGPSALTVRLRVELIVNRVQDKSLYLQ